MDSKFFLKKMIRNKINKPMELFTGQNKVRFDEWYRKDYPKLVEQQSGISVYSTKIFVTLSFYEKIGVIIAYYDSLGIEIEVFKTVPSRGMDKTYAAQITDHNATTTIEFDAWNDYFPSLPKAYEESFIQADKILNNR